VPVATAVPGHGHRSPKARVGAPHWSASVTASKPCSLQHGMDPSAAEALASAESAALLPLELRRRRRSAAGKGPRGRCRCKKNKTRMDIIPKSWKCGFLPDSALRVLNIRSWKGKGGNGSTGRRQCIWNMTRATPVTRGAHIDSRAGRPWRWSTLDIIHISLSRRAERGMLLHGLISAKKRPDINHTALTQLPLQVFRA
jgi:hypothetical protein